jgi:hypothetical protein
MRGLEQNRTHQQNNAQQGQAFAARRFCQNIHGLRVILDAFANPGAASIVYAGYRRV